MAKIEISGGVGNGLVGGGVEQGSNIGGIVRRHLEQPGGVGVLVHAFRGICGILVDGGDFAGDRCIDVGGSLDRFDNGRFLAGGVGLAEFRQFDSLEEQFLSLYHKPTEAETGTFRTIPTMIGMIRSQYHSVKDDGATYQKFGKMLKRLGYRHKHLMKGNEYLVIRNGDDGNMTADDGPKEAEPP